MAAYLYSDIYVLLSNFKLSADRSWLENPPQTFSIKRYVIIRINDINYCKLIL